jgi:hypothetical protein
VKRIAIAVMLAAATSARGALVDQFESPVLRGLGRALAVSVGKSLPIPAASSGITFTFNPRTSAFERDTEVLGQLYLERAHPIGAGRLNASLTYQYVAIDTFGGHQLDSLSDRRAIRGVGADFVFRRFDVELATHEITTSLTYGVTDDLEVNLTIPVLHTTLDTDPQLRQVSGDHPRLQGMADHDTEVGIGDVFLRGKYRLLHGRFGELAAGLVFRLPSGHEDDFQGTGLFEVSPRLYASTPLVTLAPHVRVQGYLNAGLDLTPEDTSRGEGRYGAGVDVMLATRVTLSVAFLAREPFARLVPPGTMNVPRTNGPRTPIFGLTPGHPRYYDVSVGGRVNVWRDTVFLIGNVVVPANRDGVRASVIPLIGIEATF